MSTSDKVILVLAIVWLASMTFLYGHGVAERNYQAYNAFTGNPVVSEEECKEAGGLWGELDRITWESERSDGKGTMVIEGCLTATAEQEK